MCVQTKQGLRFSLLTINEKPNVLVWKMCVQGKQEAAF